MVTPVVLRVLYRVTLRVFKDGGPSGSTVTRDEISRMPARSASPMTGGIRGGRSESDYYYIDGVKVRGTAQLPLNMESEVIDTKIQKLEYEIDLPHTIPSDGRDHLIKIKEEQPAVRYVYHAIPKLESDVFLMAELTDWASLNLLSGQSSIYYGGTFTGESYLDTKHMGDTLSLSLAREPNIFVERILDKDLNDRRIIGKSVRETFAWEIKIKNNLGKPITMIVTDQFPLADRRSIEVELLENSGAKADKKTGELTWENEIAAGEQLTLNHGYSMKYSSGTRMYFD